MRRATVALTVVVLVLAGIAYAAVSLWHRYGDHIDAGCDFGSFTTDTGQASVASQMVAVVVTRQLPERAAVLVIAAGLQESKLRNVPSGQGDRDSVGVLQQRPSQGWGTEAQLADITFATGAFLDRLVEFSDWKTLPLARAIQQVQISADEDAYTQHEGQAQAIADAFTGKTPRGISCRFDPPSDVADATTVAAAVKAQLPINAPSVRERTLTVVGAGWTTVAWFVSNADRYGIDRVEFNGGRWQRSGGWTDAPAATRTAVVATMHG